MENNPTYFPLEQILWGGHTTHPIPQSPMNLYSMKKYWCHLVFDWNQSITLFSRLKIRNEDNQNDIFHGTQLLAIQFFSNLFHACILAVKHTLVIGKFTAANIIVLCEYIIDPFGYLLFCFGLLYLIKFVWCRFIVVSTLFCCGWFVYKTRAENHVGCLLFLISILRSLKFRFLFLHTMDIFIHRIINLLYTARSVGLMHYQAWHFYRHVWKL